MQTIVSVVQTLRFKIVNKRFACISVDMQNAVTTVTQSMHQGENIKNQINHYDKQRRVLIANSTVGQSK